MAESALERILKAVMIPGGKGAGEKIRDAQLQAIDPNVDPKDIKAPLEEQSGLARFTKRFIGMPSNRDINQSFMTQLADVRAPFALQDQRSKGQIDLESLTQQGKMDLETLKAALTGMQSGLDAEEAMALAKFNQVADVATNQGMLADQLNSPQVRELLMNRGMSQIPSDTAAAKLSQAESESKFRLLPRLENLQKETIGNRIAQQLILSLYGNKPASEAGDLPIGATLTSEGTPPSSLFGSFRNDLLDTLNLRGKDLSNKIAEEKLKEASQPKETLGDLINNIKQGASSLSGEKTKRQSLTEEEGAAVMEFIRQFRANKSAGGNG